LRRKLRAVPVDFEPGLGVFVPGQAAEDDLVVFLHDRLVGHDVVSQDGQ